MVNYSELVNKGKTVYNLSGVTPNTDPQGGYRDPNALASDLGVQASGIQWGSIAKNDAYNPVPINQTQTPPPTGNQAGGLSFEAVKSAQTATPPQFGQQGQLINQAPVVTPAEQAFKNAQTLGPAPQSKAEAMKATNAISASPTFYKPPSPVSGYDPSTVFDAQGKPLSYDQYLAAGGKSDFSNVISSTPPQQSNLKGVDNILKSSAVDLALQEDPGYQQLLADRAEFNNVATQQQSLTQTYQQISNQLGIPALNTDLINIKNVIDGTEDDIRAEVTKAGGFATDSQVMALSNARNKQLIKNYNNLLDTKQMAMETLNNMTNLAAQDRVFAMNTLNQKLQLDSQIIEYRQKMQDTARQTYNNIVSQVGYAGLQKMTGGDPYYTNLVEKTLGLGSGGLAQLAVYKKPLTEMEKADLALKQAQVAQIPLENKLKQAQIANIYSGIAERNKPKIETQVVDMGGGRKVVINSQTGEIISEVGANPVDQAVKSLIGTSASWGEAADKINKAFGNENAATQYDAQLKAYFQQGKDINTAFTASTPQMQQQQATQKAQIDQITSLITDKGLNSSVGPNYLARFSVANQLTGTKANFIAGIEQIRSQLNLQSLIDAKSKGATFGALSDQELQVLANSATKIGAWAIKDKSGQVTGYKANESDFRKELDKINNFAKLDYILKGGNPEDVGVQVMPDGTHWTRNSDGTMTQI